jgi:hypothetical protein
MREEGFRWSVQRRFDADSLMVWVHRELADGRHEWVSAQLTVQQLDKHKPSEDGPTFHLTPQEAQSLMDGLWEAGVRPRDGAGSLAHVDAQKAHLEDMRRLVFGPMHKIPPAAV